MTNPSDLAPVTIDFEILMQAEEMAAIAEYGALGCPFRQLDDSKLDTGFIHAVRMSAENPADPSRSLALRAVEAEFQLRRRRPRTRLSGPSSARR